jgi:competence protein ComEC
MGWNDDSDAYAVVAAMALGDKKGLTKELKETYSVTGASHILALSGLHLSIIYTMVSLLIGRRRQMFAQIVMITGLWVFVFLVGMPTSVVRSAVMLTLYAVLSLGHRDKMSVNTLAFTAIVMMIVSPMTLFDVGFQMSYMAVFTILLFVPLFEEVFPEQYLMSHSVVKWVWGIVTVSLAAQIGTAPLTAYYFGRFSTCFLLTNLIVMPAAVVILILTMVVMLIPSLAYLLLYIVAKLNAILSWIASIPGSSINGLHPSVLQISMVYVIIIASYLLIFFLKSLAGTKKSRTFAT